jgi:hypothetical protein
MASRQRSTKIRQGASPPLTAALVGRLMHHCHLILFSGENNLLKESGINDLYRSIASTKREGEYMA